MTDNEALIAEAKRAARGKYSAFGHPELLERLIAELEAVERKPVIDREALAKFIRDDAAYNYATVLSDGEALALAEDILRFMSIEDKREVQAEALEAAADTTRRQFANKPGAFSHWLRVRAAEIREGRA